MTSIFSTLSLSTINDLRRLQGRPPVDAVTDDFVELLDDFVQLEADVSEEIAKDRANYAKQYAKEGDKLHNAVMNAERRMVERPAGGMPWDYGVASRGGAALVEEALEKLNNWPSLIKEGTVFDSFDELLDANDAFKNAIFAGYVARTARDWKLGRLRDHSEWDVNTEQQFGEILEMLFEPVVEANRRITEANRRLSDEHQRSLYSVTLRVGEDDIACSTAHEVFWAWEQQVAQAQEKAKPKATPPRHRVGF